MSKPSITVLITYQAKPGQGDVAAKALTELITTVVATERDCFMIRLLQDPADPTRILLYEEWSSKEAYLGPHFQTPHLKAFIAGADALFTAPGEISFWDMKAEILPPAGR
jgi:quinol monooxygenase YgiN